MAASFDNANSEVVRGVLTTAVPGSNAWTISAWLRRIATTTHKGIAGLWDSYYPMSNGFSLGTGWDGKPAGFISIAEAQNQVCTDSASVLSDTTFEHLVWVARSSTDHELYRNGASVDTNTGTFDLSTAADDIILNGMPKWYYAGHSCAMAEVAIWKRGFSDDDVALLNSNGVAVHGLPLQMYPADLVCYYPLNDAIEGVTFTRMRDLGPNADDIVTGTWPDGEGMRNLTTVARRRYFFILAVAGGETVQLAAAFQADANFTAALDRERELVASMTATADFTALLESTRELAAAFESTSDFTALLEADRRLAASFESTADFAADLSIEGSVELQASFEATAEFTGAMDRERRVAAAFAATADFTAALQSVAYLAAALQISADFTAVLERERGVLASFEATADFTAVLERYLALVAAFEATADFAALLSIEGIFVSGVQETWTVPTVGRRWTVPEVGRTWTVPAT